MKKSVEGRCRVLDRLRPKRADGPAHAPDRYLIRSRCPETLVRRDSAVLRQFPRRATSRPTRKGCRALSRFHSIRAARAFRRRKLSEERLRGNGRCRAARRYPPASGKLPLSDGSGVVSAFVTGLRLTRPSRKACSARGSQVKKTRGVTGRSLPEKRMRPVPSPTPPSPRETGRPSPVLKYGRWEVAHVDVFYFRRESCRRRSAFPKSRPAPGNASASRVS